jgi:hypothetical protein
MVVVPDAHQDLVDIDRRSRHCQTPDALVRDGRMSKEPPGRRNCLSSKGLCTIGFFQERLLDGIGQDWLSRDQQQLQRATPQAQILLHF